MKKTLISSLVAVLPAALLVAVTSTAASSTTVTPTLVPGNPTCESQGFDYGYKPAAGGVENAPGTYTDGPVTVTWSVAGTNGSGETTGVTWSSNIPASGVIVKAGDNANLYRYTPPSTGDTGLQTPNNNGGNQAGLSHLVFCYNYAPIVTKTANTSFKRTYSWEIDKTGDQDKLTLSTGQSFLVNYTVGVTRRAPVDSDFKVSGTISIHNPWTVALEITSVTDSLVPGEVACTGDEVAAKATVTCGYSADVADGSAGTNTATVKTKATGSDVERTSVGTKAYAFGSPTTVRDECVDVTDDKKGYLGYTCVSKTYTYSLSVGPYDTAGEYTFTNEACFATDESNPATGCDDHTVTVTVPNDGYGCTLTQGYWKTHSLKGPAPYDPAWGAVGALEQNTVFFNSGKTWYQVFWTPPAGNAYFNLAHQYMAAKLNVLNGAAKPAAVTNALASAEALFTGASGTTLSKTAATSAKQLAATLDAYNNGVTGPGHCSE